MFYALIKNNLVQSIIVADDTFIQSLTDYDHIIDVTDNRPCVGDSYYPETGVFTSNTETSIILPVENIEHLTGTEEEIVPFRLSKYSVSYDSTTKMVKIGCKNYDLLMLKDALYKGLIENQQHPHCFTSLENGPMHGKFGITWEDAQLLYDKLMKVRI